MQIIQFVFLYFGTFALYNIVIDNVIYKYNIVREVKKMEKKFIVTPKTERSVTVTVRIEMETHERLEQLVIKSGRSRNELINKAIRFALDNLEFIE